MRPCRYIYCVVLIVLSSVVMPLWADQGDLPSRSLNRWSSLSCQELYRMGVDYLDNKDKPDSALLCFTLLSNRFYNKRLSHDDRRQCIGAINTAGQIYMDYYYDFNKAYSLFIEAQRHARADGDEDILCFNYLNLANLDMLRRSLLDGDYTAASVVENYEQAFHQAVKCKAWNAITPSFINLVHIAFETQDTARLDAAIQTFKSIEFPDTTALLDFAHQLCDAVAVYRERRYDDAIARLRDLQTAVDAHVHHKNRVGTLMIAHDMRYLALKQQGRQQQAMQELDAYYRDAQQHNSVSTLQEIYGHYRDYYRQQGDTATAQHYELLSYRFKEQLVNKTRVRSMNDSQLLYEINVMGEQMKSLSYKNRVRSRILLGVILFALLLVGLLLLLHRKYKEVQEKNEQLFVKNQQLLASEDEKREIVLDSTAGIQDQLSATDAPKAKYQNSTLDEAQKSDLLHRIYAVMETSDEIYEENFNQRRLVELLGESYVNVSQVINEKYGQNFYAMLNEYRIREVCRRMNDTEHYGNLTIEAIAHSVGFKSRSNFTHNFKLITGMTPSSYMKMAKS